MLTEIEASAEAARQWGMHPDTVKRQCQIKNTKLECKRSGGVWLVTRKSMDEQYGTILDRILSGKHNNPKYGIKVLIERGEYTADQLIAAGVSEEHLKRRVKP